MVEQFPTSGLLFTFLWEDLALKNESHGEMDTEEVKFLLAHERVMCPKSYVEPKLLD